MRKIRELDSMLIPVSVALDVTKRINDWLGSGGKEEDAYIQKQIEFAEKVCINNLTIKPIQEIACSKECFIEVLNNTNLLKQRAKLLKLQFEATDLDLKRCFTQIFLDQSENITNNCKLSASICNQKQADKLTSLGFTLYKKPDRSYIISW